MVQWKVGKWNLRCGLWHHILKGPYLCVVLHKAVLSQGCLALLTTTILSHVPLLSSTSCLDSQRTHLSNYFYYNILHPQHHHEGMQYICNSLYHSIAKSQPHQIIQFLPALQLPSCHATPRDTFYFFFLSNTWLN